MRKKKISNFQIIKLPILLFFIFFFTFLSIDNSNACPWNYGDCDVAYRCDETFYLSDNWCYPFDAELICDDSSAPSICKCECPPGGCTECAVSNDPYSQNFDCEVPMVVLDKIMNYSGMGSLTAYVDMHYEKSSYVSSCGVDNYKYNFFALKIWYPCGVLSSPPYIKFCEAIIPDKKDDGWKKTSYFNVKRTGSDFQAQRIGVNKYYAGHPKATVQEFDGTAYNTLKVRFSEQLKLDPWHIGEFDNYYFDKSNNNTNLGTDFSVWRNLKYCQKYNKPGRSGDTNYDSDHLQLVGEVWVAVSAVLAGATVLFYTGPLMFMAAPLIIVGLVEAGAINKQESIDKDRYCYNEPMFYDLLWNNYEKRLKGNGFSSETCNRDDREGYCRTDHDDARSGMVIPISSPLPFYPHTQSLYKGGSYFMDTPPNITYTTTDNFDYFNPEIKINFNSSVVATEKTVTANSVSLHEHDETYSYHLIFQVEGQDNFMGGAELCLYACRRSSDSPAYCNFTDKSLEDFIINEDDEVAKEDAKTKYLISYSDQSYCVPYPNPDPAKGHKIKIQALAKDQSSGEVTSKENPFAIVEYYDNGNLIDEKKVALYHTENNVCDFTGYYGSDVAFRDIERNAISDCKLNGIYWQDPALISDDYYFSPNNSEMLQIFPLQNRNMLDFNIDTIRYDTYLNISANHSDNELVEFNNNTGLNYTLEDLTNSLYDSNEKQQLTTSDGSTTYNSILSSGADNSPNNFCSLFHFRSDININSCQGFDGFQLLCNSDSCSGGDLAAVKASDEYKNLICVHGIIHETELLANQVNSNGSLINVESTFLIHPYEFDDNEGLIENDYYDYTQNQGLSGNNNLCFQKPLAEPIIDFSWVLNETVTEPNRINPVGMLSFFFEDSGQTLYYEIDSLDVSNANNGIVTMSDTFRADFYNKYYIWAENDNGIIYIQVLRYDVPTDNNYNNTIVFDYVESLNKCPETSDLIIGATMPETQSVAETYGQNFLKNVEFNCAPVNGIEKTVTAQCDSYGNWSLDGDPHNNSCTAKCDSMSTESYSLEEYVNTSGINQTFNDKGTCNAGFTSNGNNAVTATCSVLGVWENIQNNCSRIVCDLSNIPTGNENSYSGNIGYDTVTPGTTVNLDCAAGYGKAFDSDGNTYDNTCGLKAYERGNVRPTITCNSNGTWSTVTNSCSQCRSCNADEHKFIASPNNEHSYFQPQCYSDGKNRTDLCWSLHIWDRHGTNNMGVGYGCGNGGDHSRGLYISPSIFESGTTNTLVGTMIISDRQEVGAFAAKCLDGKIYVRTKCSGGDFGISRYSNIATGFPGYSQGHKINDYQPQSSTNETYYNNLIHDIDNNIYYPWGH